MENSLKLTLFVPNTGTIRPEFNPYSVTEAKIKTKKIRDNQVKNIKN